MELIGNSKALPCFKVKRKFSVANYYAKAIKQSLRKLRKVLFLHTLRKNDLALCLVDNRKLNRQSSNFSKFNGLQLRWLVNKFVP